MPEELLADNKQEAPNFMIQSEATQLQAIREFLGMKYPFKECARPALLKRELCPDCSVGRFCEAPGKVVA